MSPVSESICILYLLVFMTVGEQIKDSEMGGVCCMHEQIEEECANNIGI